MTVKVYDVMEIGIVRLVVVIIIFKLNEKVLLFRIFNNPVDVLKLSEAEG